VRVDIDGLSFSFGDKRILKDISIEISEGEFLGLMGPNGSGKTTLLRCLMNYLPAPADAIKVDGESVKSLGPDRLARTFAVVPQSSSTDFTFSCHDIVMMGRLPHRRSRMAGPTRSDARAVREAMLTTNTWKFAARPFASLSGGERQRVVIARAIAQEPRALLLDEPTVFLDINGQLEIMDLIKRLNRERGMTVIAVLHDVNLAARYCSRIALLHGGRLKAVGTPLEVLRPEILQEVYGVDVLVRKDPLSEAVYVMPRSSAAIVHRHGRRVHVLCGGGTGGPLIKALLDSGYTVTVGVLNVLDSDYENATDLHVPAIVELPFSPIGDDAHAANLDMVGEAETVVVSPFPVGPGNFRNLEAARHALSAGKKVFFLSPETGKTVDFVDGRADEIISEMLSSGASAVSSIEELIELVGAGGRSA
jgi:iron complex transport system ATP-binding protein